MSRDVAADRRRTRRRRDASPCGSSSPTQDRDVFLAAGAVGHGAIYTQHGHHIQILRKVILRVGSYANWLVLKLH